MNRWAVAYLVPEVVSSGQLGGGGHDLVVVVGLLAHEHEEVGLDQAAEDLLSGLVVEVDNL